ncbi:Uu.00g039460.m01.CDS01 [Anthostomella pinea]|uniref:Uu.00g039460.m01.CDS01 n=1 Tax=Anthostomella pinea TaxID=933095 RepID=A0AAI8YDZ4_9PEZI|nr:Uu.00g039460.m01.CDS01 [Anthostomella pinea]
MGATYPTTTNPFESPFEDPSPIHRSKDEWEDWVEEDDDEPTRGNNPDALLIDLSDDTAERSLKPATRHTSTRNPQHRHSVHKPVRLKSKGRQKAQNAKAGIKVVTDMSQLRSPAPPAQPRPMGHNVRDENKGRFVDAAALLALEGEPNSDSVGSFSWLKRKPGNVRAKQATKEAAQVSPSGLSPMDRPIVIGLSVPSDDAGQHQVSPQTAVVETPTYMQSFTRRADAQVGTTPTPQPLHSVWSPDTEVSESNRDTRTASSIYSRQSTSTGPAGSIYSQPTTNGGHVPPVPALPATMKFKQSMGRGVQDDDDLDTPCTLFEEDGSPTATRKSQKPKAAAASPGSASSRANGWWDHVTTPFTQQSTNPFKQQAQETGSSSSAAPREWWSGVDEKKAQPSRSSGLTIVTPASLGHQHTAPPAAVSSQPASVNRTETQSEKARILLEEDQTPNDQPPPYEFTKTFNEVKPPAVVAAPYVNTQPIPSPGPMTPGLPGTMTSQGAIHMAEIPLTPTGLRLVPEAVLPDRAAGSYVTGDQFYDAPGRANKSERQRRRHEKEDAVARKLGGFWRGRGFMSDDGCFGRTGREGRKRRRICLGVIGGVIAAIILAVIIAVVLTQRHISSSPSPSSSSAPSSSEESQAPSVFLTVAGFPPMPTGVLTVAGPDNSLTVSGCFTDKTPPTAWSCSLPKGEQDADAPFAPNQPEFIFQIQYDNNTRALWKISDDDDDNDKHSKSDRRDFLADVGFAPDPDPPSVTEMRFLGNTTDHIVADEKEGEPTPFFISLLKAIGDTVGPNVLSRRQGSNNAIDGSSGNGTGAFNLSDILPAPELNGDGTGAPARLFPLPTQQPVRLFDRGLPTEHYGFYTHFDKTIYLANSTGNNTADKDGGALITDAKSLVTFAQTRFLVKMWTRKNETAQLLGDGAPSNSSDGSSQPGTMPYPVTIAVDQHGGDASKKLDFSYGVMDNKQINLTDPHLVVMDLGSGGTLVNGASDPDTKLGGIDGGTGGCKCEWVNFKGGK